MTIKNIFDEIADESSTNEKMIILGKYKDNKLLEQVLYLANSKRIKFYIKQIPEYINTKVELDLQTAIDSLSDISDRVVTGHAAIEHLTGILSSLSVADAYIIERIIEKDCKIGMGTANINKVFKKLIEDTPYMGAKSYDEKLAKKIFEKGGKGLSQIKMDGRYCNAIIRSGDVELESRQGEPTILRGAKFLNELTFFSDCVLNGELTMDGISRYESNGIVASLVSIGSKKLLGEDVTKEIAKFEQKHMRYQEALDSIRFTVWDIISVDEYFNAKSDTIYLTRLKNLDRVLDDTNPNMVSMIGSKQVDSYAEAMEAFQEALMAGHEGTILKSDYGTWKDGKPNWQVKMKLEMDVDLKITGFNYGEKGKKNEHVISSFTAESSDGLLVTRPQGLTEEMMKEVTENQDKLLGTIIQCRSYGISKPSNGKYSMLHPVFVRLRDDKNTCDSLESIKEIEAMVKGLTTK